jgi:glycosyltransferase involved in cell wall biosynthesis
VIDNLLPTLVIVAGRVPEPIRSGLDLRLRAQIFALSKTFNVTLVAITSAPTAMTKLPATIVSLELEFDFSEPELIRSILAKPEEPFATLFDSTAARRIQQLITTLKPSTVIISRIQNWIYAETIRATTSAPLILDLDESAERLLQSFQNLSYRGITRSLHLRYTRAMALYEDVCLAEADEIWVSSQVEKIFLGEKKSNLPPVHIVVNSVAIPETRIPAKENSRPRIIFTGTFAYPPNLQAAIEIAHEIAPLMPEIDFVLAGSHASRSICKSIGGNVTIVSPVTDVQHLMIQSDVAILPIRAGGGTRFKALEAMAVGVPCVGTHVAFEGLGVRDGEEVILAETSADFVAAIRRVIGDAKLSQRLSRKAFAYVNENHSPSVLARDLSMCLPASESEDSNN